MSLLTLVRWICSADQVVIVRNGSNERRITCQTPTMALAMRMRRMTKGSTKAVTVSSSSSKKANTKEMMAANRRIFTSRSSNCSMTNCQRDLPSSAGNSLGPYLAAFSLTWSKERPRWVLTLKLSQTSDHDFMCASSMMRVYWGDHRQGSAITQVIIIHCGCNTCNHCTLYLVLCTAITN